MKIDSSRVTFGSQAVAARFIARQFKGNKITNFALNSCCVNPSFQSIYKRPSFIDELRGSLDEEHTSRTLAEFVALNRQLNAATLASGEDPMVISDRMDTVREELTRLGTTTHPNLPLVPLSVSYLMTIRL